LERGLAQQAQLGGTQAIALLERFAHQATAQKSINQGGQPPTLEQQEGIGGLAGGGLQQWTWGLGAGRAGPKRAGLTLPGQGLPLASQNQATLLKGQKQWRQRSQQVAEGGATPVGRFRALELVEAMALLALGRREFEPQLVLQPLAVERIGCHHHQIVNLQGLRRKGQGLGAAKGLCRQDQEFGSIAMAAPELPPQAGMAGPELLG
jgi:hypothetical protein